MKSFKHFLLEEVRSETARYYVFSGYHIPLSKNMMSRLRGNIEEKYGIHITSIDNLEGLLSIQNSAKQISVMTESRNSFDRLVGGGVATEGGIWTLVYGFPVIESGSDFWSIVDNQGRRWIRIDRLSEQAERSKSSSKYLSDLERLGEAIHELRREILLKTISQFPNDDYMKNLAQVYKDDDLASEKFRGLNDTYGSYVDEEWSNLNGSLRDNKIKGWMIRQYYDGIEGILKRGFLKVLDTMMKDTDTEKYSSWNEISMNNFEVAMIGVANPNLSNEAEEIANSSGIPIDAMYPNTAKKAQSYFNALDSANKIKKLVNSAIPPSGS